MSQNPRRLLQLVLSGALLWSPFLFGQTDQHSASGPLTRDWSDQQIIFSHPANADRAARLEKDPRYLRQMRRNAATTPPDVLVDAVPPLAAWDEHRKQQKSRADWAQDLGPGASLGALNYPAKYSFSLTTASCASAAQPDFVVYGTGLAGSATQASIVAYDNLYSGCSGTVPQVYWAYNTNGGTVTTSPIFSLDGTQIAFTQNNGAGQGMLVLLKWAPSNTESVGNPLSLTRVTNAAYPSCTAPCMTTTFLTDAFGTSDLDTNSSVFIDYADDAAYVGDDAGWLHQITPVFKGAPSEVRTAGWPVQVDSVSPTALASPVFDSTSGYAFVTDAGGFLYRIGPNSAFVVSSGQLDFAGGEGGSGLVQGPIVDSANQSVYAFSGSDGTGACAGGADCSAVYHLNTPFAPGSIGTEATVGSSTIAGTTPNPLYLGGFDSTYLNSVDGTGHIYVCGNTGGSPTLYQMAVQAGALGSVSAGPVLANSTTPCSPVTDVLNPNASGGQAEWIYASAQANAIPTACAARGCIINFVDTPWRSLSAYRVGQEVLDSHLQIQVVTANGTSGASLPGWQTIPGRITTDGSVSWINQGPQTATTPGSWVRSRAYAKGNKILDPNGNIQLVTTAGTSNITVPLFNTTAGGTTNDGARLVWTNVGAIATAALPAAGGTSGIVFDNTVGPGTLAGASQIYYSTLSNQVCGTSGTGGCAVQASQSALH